MLFHAAFLFCLSAPAYAETGSIQPYIDQLKKDMPPSEGKREGSFIESVRQKLPSEPSGSYIDHLKSNFEQAPERKSAIEKERARQSAEGKNQTSGPIEKLKTGKSELELRRPGEIGNAMGFRIGATLTRDITATNGAGAKNYSDIYGGDRVPEISLFYEFQPFHSEWFGNVGFFGNMGVGFDSGKGTFQYQPPNAGGGAAFTAESRTRFKFFYAPVVAGMNYRFNLFRIVRPFVMAGPALIPYWETRDDSKPGVKGFSRGLYVSAGASLLLDFVNRASAWDLYEAHGVKHYYLTVDYSRLTTSVGDVLFNVNGFSAGFTFEF